MNHNSVSVMPMPYKDKEFAKARHKEYSRAHYEKNIDMIKARTADRNKRQRATNREFVINIKESTPCMDCNKKYPYYVMHFDHIYEKSASISNLVRASYSLKRIQQEIDNCEIVCANCHAIRTYERKMGSDEDLNEWI